VVNLIACDEVCFYPMDLKVKLKPEIRFVNLLILAI
jgi:hypothetical protein